MPWPEDDYLTPASKRGPPPFDFVRLTRFMAYGFIMAPVQHRWFGWLSRLFPIGGGKGTTNALKRVAFDQFIFAPCGELDKIIVLASMLTMYHRSGSILHLHDCRRRRRQASCDAQVPRRLSACTQSQLHSLAVGTDAELQSHPDSIPDRKQRILRRCNKNETNM